MIKADKLRKNIFLYTSYALAILIIVRLFQLQIVQFNVYNDLSERQTIQIITVEQGRGDIVDRHGQPLATNKYQASLYAFGRDVQNPQGLQQALSEIGINISNTTVERLEDNNNFVWVSRVQLENLRPLVRNYLGIYNSPHHNRCLVR